MSEALALLRHEPRARVFFAALAQSGLGTGAGYVGLLLVAYDRLRSPWAIALVLLADFLPSMFLGPLLGAAVDRWSRRRCAVIADVLRAAAFVGIALVGSFEATFVLALFAGIGTALFRPATLAALTSLVDERRTPAATSLYGAIGDLGYTVGPAIAAGALLFLSPEGLLWVNGATFAVSAVVLMGLDFGQPARGRERSTSAGAPGLIHEAREGLKATARMPGVRLVVGIAAAAMLSGGIFNVVELPFARDVLDAGASGYSVLVTVYGVGFVVGSLSGAKGGTPRELRRRFAMGLFATGAGGLGAGLSPGLGVAALAFGVGGLGNGLTVVHMRLLIQSQVAGDLHGRVFGLSDALTSWWFAAGFISAGALTEAVGSRTLIALTGVWEVALGMVALLTIRRGSAEQPQEPAGEAASSGGPWALRGGDAVGHLNAGD